jgi:hypothetical protein
MGKGLLVVGYWLLVIGYWLLAVGYWLLAIGCWLLAVGYWLVRCLGNLNIQSYLSLGEWLEFTFYKWNISNETIIC